MAGSKADKLKSDGVETTSKGRAQDEPTRAAATARKVAEEVPVKAAPAAPPRTAAPAKPAEKPAKAPPATKAAEKPAAPKAASADDLVNLFSGSAQAKAREIVSKSGKLGIDPTEALRQLADKVPEKGQNEALVQVGRIVDTATSKAGDFIGGNKGLVEGKLLEAASNPTRAHVDVLKEKLKAEWK